MSSVFKNVSAFWMRNLDRFLAFIAPGRWQQNLLGIVSVLSLWAIAVVVIRIANATNAESLGFSIQGAVGAVVCTPAFLDILTQKWVTRARYKHFENFQGSAETMLCLAFGSLLFECFYLPMHLVFRLFWLLSITTVLVYTLGFLLRQRVKCGPHDQTTGEWVREKDLARAFGVADPRLLAPLLRHLPRVLTEDGTELFQPVSLQDSVNRPGFGMMVDNVLGPNRWFIERLWRSDECRAWMLASMIQVHKDQEDKVRWSSSEWEKRRKDGWVSLHEAEEALNIQACCGVIEDRTAMPLKFLAQLLPHVLCVGEGLLFQPVTIDEIFSSPELLIATARGVFNRNEEFLNRCMFDDDIRNKILEAGRPNWLTRWNNF